MSYTAEDIIAALEAMKLPKDKWTQHRMFSEDGERICIGTALYRHLGLDVDLYKPVKGVYDLTEEIIAARKTAYDAFAAKEFNVDVTVKVRDVLREAAENPVLLEFWAGPIVDAVAQIAQINDTNNYDDLMKIIDKAISLTKERKEKE